MATVRTRLLTRSKPRSAMACSEFFTCERRPNSGELAEGQQFDQEYLVHADHFMQLLQAGGLFGYKLQGADCDGRERRQVYQS